MCGYPPFCNDNEMYLFEMIMKAQYVFEEEFWSDVSPDCKAIIAEMLLVDPVARYTTDQILKHRWITGADALPKINLSKSISMNLEKTVKRHDGPAARAATNPGRAHGAEAGCSAAPAHSAKRRSLTAASNVLLRPTMQPVAVGTGQENDGGSSSNLKDWMRDIPNDKRTLV